MPGKKKKFIDKKHAVTFSVVSRSQKDPQLLAGKSENVLLPNAVQPKKSGKSERLAEQHKYGIYYDDDYDYLQHLRDVDELNDVEILDRFRIASNSADGGTKLSLPSSVFGSEVETKVGLLNRAAPLKGPQIDWDPDIVAGLDVDFNFDDPDGILDDDFIAKAEGPMQFGETELREEIDDLFEDEEEAVVIHCHSSTKPKPSSLHKLQEVCEQNEENDDDWETDDEGEDADDNDDDEEDGSDDNSSNVGSNDFMDDESISDGKAKTALTSYSMSSSVVPRSEALSLLDERFEKFAEQYCEEDIGDLSHEEIEGFIRGDSERLELLLQHFEKRNKKITLKDFIMKAAEHYAGSNDKEEMVEMVVDEPAEKWDCETILSTRSTLYNHPHTIKEEPKPKPIKLTKHSQVPDDVLNKRGPTRRQVERIDTAADKSLVPQRQKGESLEEKKARKQAIKDMRRNRREEKSATKKAFVEEKLKHSRDMSNVQRTIQAVHLS